ncbi:hypothetical protein FLBR109950_14220 [Flavobacterium branchiophilum]
MVGLLGVITVLINNIPEDILQILIKRIDELEKKLAKDK